MCVFALSVMPMVGCSEADGTGGSGGSGGTGGTGGVGGTGGTVDLCEGVVCDDNDVCTEDACNPANGECEFAALCGDGRLCACSEKGILCAVATGDGTYTFSCGEPTTVKTTAEIIIDNDVILDGEGMMTIDADHQHRVLSVTPGVTAELHRLTLTRGSTEGFGLDGGAVLNEGNLKFNESRISNSVARGHLGLPGLGGGIYNDGALTLTNTTVSYNEAEGGAGMINQMEATVTIINSAIRDNVGVGISARGTVTLSDSTVERNSDGGISSAGTLTIVRTFVSHNSSKKDGGGLAVHGGSATVRDSTFSQNNAVGNGGAVFVSGDLSLTNSTLLNNAAQGDGGGLFQYLGTSALTASTVSGNTAGGGGGGIYAHGQGLTLTSSTVLNNFARTGGGIFGGGTFINSTISGNEAEYDGGGIVIEFLTTLTYTTVAVNIAGRDGNALQGMSPEPATLTGTLIEGACDIYLVVSNGHNIESSGDTCGLDTAKGDQINVSWTNLNLGPLTDNGGPTMTHKPGDGGFGEGSAAIDAIPGDACEVTEDQRGKPRPETDGTTCDVGSVEVQP